MKIGILQTGHPPDELRAKFGDYDQFFSRYLSDRGFSFVGYPVLEGVFPDSPRDADGWLITGSRFGAYEAHEWIAPLEKFLRDTYDQSIPIVGVCFGHQILAQALGGRVEKYADGWSVGPVCYRSDLFGAQTMIAWHQDQVVTRPAGATVVASTDFCENAMLQYGNKALTIQAHPEFDREFFLDLIEQRGNVLPDKLLNMAKNNADTPLTSQSFAQHIEEFFKNNASAKNSD